MRHLWFAMLLFCINGLPVTAADLGMGLRIGEVTQTSAVIWTRITDGSDRNPNGHREPKKQEPKVDEYLPYKVPVSEREGEMPGKAGQVRLVYQQADAALKAVETAWIDVTAEGDFIHQFEVNDLNPGKHYRVEVQARDDANSPISASVQGSFSTPQTADGFQDVTFGVVTGQSYWDLDDKEGYHIYPAMQSLNLNFIVPTGDTVYYDNEAPRARTLELARYHWHRMYTLPRHIEFHQNVPGYWEVDDHDALSDDCWPTMKPKWMLPLTFEQGYATFREQVPLGSQPTHRTVRWGKGLQIWMVEGRLYRSPNNAPDGPEKSIWGKEQREWLMKSILESDADFKVLISPTPIVGPDRGGKRDNHANSVFQYEGDLFRNWTQQHKLSNFFVCCGDRHWQYYSIDPKTGLKEFSCGPASNQHAGGTPGQDFEVQPFHRVKGGFLTVNVFKEAEKPTIAFRHHDIHGILVNEYKQSSSGE